MSAKGKIIFIVNPKSGTGKQKLIEALIKENLDHDKYNYKIVYTKYQGEGRKLAGEAIGKKTDIIVVVGGDGSINEVASAIVNSNIILGIIPAGSGNGFANHLNIPLKINQAIQVINKKNVISIDTATINNKLFISIAGLGFDGHISKKYARVGKRGFWPYFRLVTEEFGKYKPKTYEIIIDGKRIRKTAMMINFANTDQFGYNTSIAPEAKINDGLIDVCILQKPPVIKLPYLVHLLYHKKIHQSRFMELHKAKKVIVKQSKKRTINIDGEAMKLGKKVEVKIDPLSLRIIVP